MTNAGFSDATTVVSHDSASTSITPPADSRLASKYACVVRSNITSNVQREGIRCWQPLIQMMVVTRRAAEKAYERLAETDYCSKLMRSCCAGGVGLLSADCQFLVCYRTLAPPGKLEWH